jgi:hypothetical protein
VRPQEEYFVAVSGDEDWLRIAPSSSSLHVRLPPLRHEHRRHGLC